MERQIKENSDLLKALVAVQDKLITLPVDTDNPFFKSKYLSLASVLQAAKPLLTDNGVVFLQSADMKDECLIVTTELAHENGEYIRTDMELPFGALKDTKNFMQAIGSAITYMRRYQATAILGLVGDDDDDANQLNGAKPPERKPSQSETQVKMEEGRRNISQMIEDNRDILEIGFVTAIVDNSDSAKTPDDLRETWKQLKSEVTRLRRLEQKDREALVKAEINAGGKKELVEKIAGIQKLSEIEPKEDLPTVDTENELDIF
jgi:hypothetical protein